MSENLNTLNEEIIEKTEEGTSKGVLGLVGLGLAAVIALGAGAAYKLKGKKLLHKIDSDDSEEIEVEVVETTEK